MAVGDDALAAGMELVAGTALANTIDTEINLSRDYIAQRTAAVTPVERGGTGATTAAGARTKLGFPDLGRGDAMPPNAIAVSNAQSQLTTGEPTLGGHAAPKGYVDRAVAGVVIPVNPTFGTVTVTGNLFVPNSSIATAGWTQAYINNDGRLTRGASSERYKEEICDAGELGDLFPALQTFRMRGGDGRRVVGYIAERFAERPDLEPFVSYQVDPLTGAAVLDDTGAEIPEAIDYVQLLLAQVAQLHARVVELEERISAT